DALADSGRAAGDRIYLGAAEQQPSDAATGFDDGGLAVKIFGSGPASVIAGSLHLRAAGSAVDGVSIQKTPADAPVLVATGDVRVSHATVSVAGRGLHADGAKLTLDDVDVTLAKDAEYGLQAGCD